MPRFLRRKSTYLIGVPLLLVLAFVGGPFVYIHFIEGSAPKKLSFATVTSPRTSVTIPAATTTGIDGNWKLTTGTTVGYRVAEVLFGQSTTAVGRTHSVTGTLTIGGTMVPSGSFTADMTTVASDQSRRDDQFQHRVMDTSTYPTATFTLTKPIALGSVPADLVQVKVPATGELTLHGTKRAVTFSLTARRNGDTIEVNGSIPVTFADYNIPNPSFGPAQTSDHGELEFLLVFSRA
jgi:polyisoprenoid-binding protein YceI